MPFLKNGSSLSKRINANKLPYYNHFERIVKLMNTPRSCPVCNHHKSSQLFRQSFSSLSQGSLLDGYALAICESCGAGYAQDIPSQTVFDRYYTEMSKYEYIDRLGVQTDSELQRFREEVNLVVPYLTNTDRILDIGCSTGGLLAEFKRRGFSNLLGVDPSPACAKFTEELYGITAKPATISILDRLNEQVDIAFLTGVLEHLRDLDSSLDRVKSCLKKGGLIFLVVPDATRYDRHFSAPFQFFSMEHINYFSPLSLSNLMVRHGFSAVFTERLTLQLTANANEPSIAGLFRWDLDPQNSSSFVRDDETEPALCRYIQQSQTLEQQIQAKIDRLVDASQPLAVWGVGTHTLRLLETSRLSQAKLVTFIDSNINYQGKTLAGIPVISPAEFNNPTAEILISSQTAEPEIFQAIDRDWQWQNQIHRLYHNN
jgi:predicted TPR repeat methyltransferase